MMVYSGIYEMIDLSKIVIDLILTGLVMFPEFGKIIGIIIVWWWLNQLIDAIFPNKRG